jgi:hypothetical protein
MWGGFIGGWVTFLSIQTNRDASPYMSTPDTDSTEQKQHDTSRVSIYIPRSTNLKHKNTGRPQGVPHRQGALLGRILDVRALGGVLLQIMYIYTYVVIHISCIYIYIYICRVI